MSGLKLNDEQQMALDQVGIAKIFLFSIFRNGFSYIVNLYYYVFLWDLLNLSLGMR
jgi:hypothetical protein